MGAPTSSLALLEWQPRKANASRVIYRVGLSRLEKKFSAELTSFVSEKMKENEPEPPVYEKT
jgi:hypothetical protein